MKPHILLATILLLVAFDFNAYSQSSVFSHLDTIVEYDEQNPPTQPLWGEVGKWVRTERHNWNSESFKCYIYKGMAFRIKYPKNFDTTGAKKYPLILMLHGRGESGELYDNEWSMKHGGKQHRNAIDNDEFDGFVMYPQNQTGFWGAPHFDFINELINNFFPDIHIDRNRVSVHGLSAGGAASWNIILRHPRTFAAALPMSGSSLNFIAGLPSVKYIPIWQFQGGLDIAPSPYTTEQLINAGWDLGMDITYTEYPDLGHGVWYTAYDEDDFFPYMTRANKTNPIVFFEKSEFCPNDTIDALLGVQDSLLAYEWRKNGILIPGADSNTYRATSLGTYDCRFKRDSIDTNWSQWSEIPVVIQMKDSTAAPTIEVIGLNSRVFPAPDSLGLVTLGVPETFHEYAWKYKDSTTAIDSSAEYIATEVGEYVVSVKEKFGCESTESLPFKVIDANGVNLPDAPLYLGHDSIGKTVIGLSWTDNPSPAYNETGYEIYRTETSGGPYTFIALTNSDQESFLDSGLMSGQTYYYILRAVNDDGASAITSELSVTTESDTIRPTAPLNFAVITTRPTEIELNWDPSTDNVGIDKYDIYLGDVKVKVTSDTFVTIYNLTHKEVYNFTVRARDFSGNESPHSSVLTAATATSGLNFSYYHGNWNSLPDFSSLTPEFSGTINNVDISVRTRDYYFGFVWEGYINIPVAGNYTFETRSDDGSKVYIGAFDEDSLVVDNDGLHGAKYKEGTKHFGTPGSYKIFITFFERTGGQTMTLYWKNTAHGVTTRQVIPDSAFTEAVEYSGVPDSASHLTARATGYHTIELKWQDNSSDETGFQIFRMENSEGIYRPAGKVAKNVTSWTDTDLPSGTTYTYKIVTLGATGQSVAVEMEIESEGHWGFNNNGNDDSGNNVTNLSIQGPTFVSDTLEGSHVLDFDGVDDIVSFGPNDRTSIFQKPVTTRSYSFWMKLDDPMVKQVIYEEGAARKGMEIAISSGKLACAVSVDFQINYFKVPYTSTGWTHVTFAIDGDNMRLHMNGVEVAYQDELFGHGLLSRGTGAIGGISPNGSLLGAIKDNFEGQIDDLFIMDYYMTANDDKDLMNRALLGRNTVTTWSIPNSPKAPTKLVADALSSSEIDLTWRDKSDYEINFVVYRSENDTNNFVPVAVLPKNSIQYTDTGLPSSSIFFYKIGAVNDGGTRYSNIESDTTFNNAPVIDTIVDFAMHYSTSMNVQISAVDPDLDNITLSGINLPSFAILTDNGDGSGSLSISPTIADTNVYSNIIVKATDIYGDADSTVFNLTINENYIPTLNVIADIIMNEGDSLGVELVGYDSNGVNTMNWSGINLPGFVTLVPDTDGTALLKLLPDYIDGGYYAPITVKVTDDKNAEVERVISITVNEVNPNQTVKVNIMHSTAASSPWNNVQSAQTAVLTNAEGDTSFISMEFLPNVWSTKNKGQTTGDNSGIVPDDVLNDFYYNGLWGRPDTTSIIFTGLNPDRKFDLTMIGSARWNYETVSHTIYWSGSNIDSVYTKNNTSESAVLKALVPDSAGTLIVHMTRGAYAQAAYLNGFILEDIYDYSGLPAPPRELTASFANHSVDLSWYDAPYNEKGYDVYRSEVQGGPYTLLTTTSLAANSTSYNDDNVEAEKTYYYVVQAVNDNGVSVYSNEAEAYVSDMPPTISVIGDLTIEVDYTGTVWAIEAKDLPTSVLTLSVTDLPSFATFGDSGNGMGSITFTPEMSDIGMHSFSIEAEDENSDVGTENYTINVIEKVDPVLYSMKINFNQWNAAPAPWNNVGGLPSQNDTLAGLVNDTGVSTPAGLIFESTFGGTLQLGAQTGDNSGIVPDAALKEFYWFGYWTAAQTAQMKLIGLDNTKKYNIHFIGSSTFSVAGITDNGSTDYKVGNRTVSLHVQDNTANEAVMKNVVANEIGEIIIDLEKGANASMGVINAIIVDVLEGNPEVFEPNGLVASAVSSSQINLTWNDNSHDETNYVIYRSLTALEQDFVAIDTVAANVKDYLDMGLLSETIYFYKVRGLKNSGMTEYSNVASSGTISFSVFINLNGTSATDEAVPWNNLSSTPEDGDLYIGFKTSTGNQSGLEMEWVAAMSESNDWGATTGDNSGVYPDNVMKSFYLMDGYERPAEVALSGLSQEYDYNISFFGSMQTGYNINTSFTIGDVTVTNSQTYNTTEVVTINNVTPDINNEILFTVKEVSGSKWGIFNAVVVNAVKAREISNARTAGSSGSGNPNAITVNYGKAVPEIGIYPNPTDYDNFNLYYKDAPEGDVVIKISDIMGRVVEIIEMSNQAQEGEFHINLDKSLLTGIYVVTAEFNDGRVSQTKLVKR